MLDVCPNKNILLDVWDRPIFNYFDYTLLVVVCQELARYIKGFGQIFSTFLRSVREASGEMCFFGTQKYNRQQIWVLMVRIGMLLPIEYKPTSENTLTRSDQGRQAVVGRGA